MLEIWGSGGGRPGRVERRGRGASVSGENGSSGGEEKGLSSTSDPLIRERGQRGSVAGGAAPGSGAVRGEGGPVGRVVGGKGILTVC